MNMRLDAVNRAGEFANRLLELSEGGYPSFTDATEHGARLARYLSSPADMLEAAYCHRLLNEPVKAGVVLTRTEFLFLPMGRYASATKAFMGAVKGNGDILVLPLNDIGSVATAGREQKTGWLEDLRTGLASHSHFVIDKRSGGREQLVLGSMLPVTAPHTFVRRLQTLGFA